jgi:enoyl-CoA hydratase
MSSTLLIARNGPVAVLTLNRPEALNALSPEMRQALSTALEALARDEQIAAVVLTGAGERAFTAGMDLKAAAAALAAGEPARDETPVEALDRFPKPIVAAINGLCITAGLEMALCCDVIVAARTARFGDTHVRLGILPGWGGAHRLARRVGPHLAKELILTGRFVDAERALQMGLVNQVVEPSKLMACALDLANGMAEGDREVMLAYKALVDDGFRLDLAGALALSRERGPAQQARLQARALEARRLEAMARNREEDLPPPVPDHP